MDDRVVLRPATAADVDRVYAWANDPLTRAVSFSSAEITYSEHVAWFTQQLERSDRNLLIAMSTEHPAAAIATIRIDRAAQPGVCIISINLAPEARGRGLGTAALEAATASAAALGFSRIHALIRPDNQASIRAFTRAGYVQAESTEVGDQPALLFVRQRGPSQGNLSPPRGAT